MAKLPCQCLINATATGTDILKSLVLPGMGNLTILDPNPVTGEDAENNFLLTLDSIGQSRGELVIRLLLDMNHEIRGESSQGSVEQVLHQLQPGSCWFASLWKAA